VLAIIISLTMYLTTPNYAEMGFEEAEELDSMLERGGKLFSNAVFSSVGLDSEFVCYGDIGFDDKVKIDVDGKTVKAKYFGYNPQDGCHYVYLTKPFGGESVFRISESNCDINQ
jgi:hypothetical protein